MAFVGTYLNFPLKSEEAFNWYRSIFNPEAPMTIMRFSDTPMAGNLPESERHGVMHATLEILDGHKLYATDMLESMGHEVKVGNNTTLNLNIESREEIDRIYAHLSQDATEKADPHEEPWGYWGVCLDKYGVRWMFNQIPSE
ncbi:MAG: VOC family protein [Actinobacteria bacterium]|nr:VOC family protein [Actinomycetota bacterium]